VRNRTRNARSASYAAFVGVRNLLWDIRVKDAGRPHTVFTDAQGNVVPGATAESSALFAQALHAFNIYRGDPVALVDRAIAAAPGCAMSHLLKTYLLALATEPAATAAARETLAAARALPLDERAASHAATLTLLLDGEWTAAAVALDRHNASYPRDLLGLQCGHLMDFYRANARNLRDRIARVLPHWSPDVPGYPVVLGMYAFGLEESGAYARAEDTGREAVDREPLDCWAHHAVAHVMEMQGRAQDGIGWMVAREPFWSGDDNFFKVHNWWHLALYHLDLGDAARALALYDGRVRESRSAVALDMVDASALLWRLTLVGHDVSDRWEELAAAWDQHADGRLYPFNDWHAVMAYLGAGRDGDVQRIVDAFREGANEARETHTWAREVGLSLVEGFTAFFRGDHAGAVERLYRTRYIANRFGGSHAQRDVIDWTLAEAAVRGGIAGLAEAMASERLALKRHSPVNLGLLSRARSTRVSPATR